LVGKWIGVDRWPNGVPYTVVLTFNKDGSYSVLKTWQERVVAGVPIIKEQLIEGTYTVDEDTIGFTTKGGKPQLFDYRFRRSKLSVWTDDLKVGKIHYDLKRAPD
jgi:hypothetical protein